MDTLIACPNTSG